MKKGELWGQSLSKPATAKQKKLMRDLGLEFSKDISITKASDLITNELDKRYMQRQRHDHYESIEREHENNLFDDDFVDPLND